ncbi:MAG: hypothetical protein F6J98_33865, partial [Moorea sp. SIO4G2]|nr:hypothetical protein [Moorena sp. SIO4G2]
MGALSPEQIGQLVGITNVQEFREFLMYDLGISLLNEVVLATIANEFHLGELGYAYDQENSMHQFSWAATINVAPDDEVSDTSEEPQSDAPTVCTPVTC